MSQPRGPRPRVMAQCSHPGCTEMVETSINMAQKAKCKLHNVHIQSREKARAEALANTNKVIPCRYCGKPVTVARSARFKTCDECYQARREQIQRKKDMPIVLVDCDKCEHEKMCRKNIWDVWFNPPCFAGEKDKLIREATE